MNPKDQLLSEAKKLTAKKKRLYSHMDITSPKSEYEKQLERKIAGIYSEINQLIRKERKIQ